MADFNIAIKTVLENEGGYVDDPDDKGGETNFGISKRSYPSLDIKNLTMEEASAIYQKDFWKFDGINDQAVATKLFDSFVNMGRRAIRFAQALVGAAQDGAYGPGTEAAINSADPEQFLSGYRNSLVDYYRGLVERDSSLGEFLAGWLRRAAQ